MAAAGPESAVAAAAAGRCAECGHALGGRYCSNCGQEAHITLPTFREFLHEAIGEHFALESKLFRTIWVLVRSPGLLTAEYVAGRRQRYLRPLRLYLTLSLLFFLVLGLTSKTIVHVQNSGPAAAVGSPAAAGPAKPSAAASVAAAPVVAAKEASDKAESQGMDVQFEAGDNDSTGNAYLDERIKRFSQLSNADKSKAMSQSLEQGAPYAIFVLMPLFAAGLKLLYLGTGRTYGEHFVFALHAQSFAYLALLVARIKELPWLKPYEDAFLVAMGIGLLVYLYLAMRRFYLSPRWSTVLRMGVLLFAYSISLAIALAFSALVAIVE